MLPSVLQVHGHELSLKQLSTGLLLKTLQRSATLRAFAEMSPQNPSALWVGTCRVLSILAGLQLLEHRDMLVIHAHSCG